MALWGLNDASTNATKYPVRSGSAQTGISLYGNVSPSVVTHATDVAVGVFAVDPTEAAVAAGKVTHPGWVVVTQGTGPINSVTITNGGTTYGNLAVITFSNGSSNAAYLATTNSSGGITSVTVSDAGHGFINVADVVLVDPANSIYTLSVSDGGRNYSIGDVITVSNGEINATATVATVKADNAAINTITMTSAGRGFVNATTLSIAVASTTKKISQATINDGGLKYANNDQVVFSNGTSNATANTRVNMATGNITSLVFNTPGAGFVNVTATVVTFVTTNTIYAATIGGGGTGYSNSDVVTFSNGSVNATATATTNSTGGITSLTFTSGGRGFINATATVVGITTSGGSGANIVPTVASGTGANIVPAAVTAGTGATFAGTMATGDGNFTATVTLGGRAGRVSYETLVATSSITGDGSDDNIFPDS